MHKLDNATITICSSPAALGDMAAEMIAAELRTRLLTRRKVRMIFAAAPSQLAMLERLAQLEGIDWGRVEAFHMDEYVGLEAGAPQLFGNWLRRKFFDLVSACHFYRIDPKGQAELIAEAYASLLGKADIDIVCLGIGMNGHLAFNDPPARFEDENDVRLVTLATESRMQQVREGLFATLADVPKQAITLTIPRLLRADRLFCCVSGTLKASAVTRAFTSSVAPDSPASILRQHAGCSIFLDREAAAGLTFLDEDR